MKIKMLKTASGPDLPGGHLHGGKSYDVGPELAKSLIESKSAVPVRAETREAAVAKPEAKEEASKNEKGK